MIRELLSSPNIDPNLCAAADIDSPRLPLLAAAQPHAPVSLLGSLLSHPRLDVNAKEPSRSWSVLHYLACRPHDTGQRLEMLLSHPRIRVNDLTAFGSSALHLAARSGSLGAMRLLLLGSHRQLDHHQGVDVNLLDVNLQDTDGETALHKACISGHGEAVRVICMEGPESLDVNARSATTGHAPLHEACIRGCTTSVLNLFSHPRLIPSIQDRSGSTALHLAVKHGHMDTAKALLQTSTIDVNAR